MYNGSNQAVVCYTCAAATVSGSAPPSNSLDTGTGVSSLTGDFTTSHTMFDAQAIGTSLGITLSYDAEMAQSELASGSGNGAPFGWGWTSNFGASDTPSGGGMSGQVTVTQGDGSQVTFAQASNGACPTGDYAQPSQYTVSFMIYNSTHQWCALQSVQAQFGDQYGQGTLYLAQGGKDAEAFYWNGSLEEEGTRASLFNGTNQGVSAFYAVAPGTAPLASQFPNLQKCPTTASQCTVYVSSDGRDIVESLNSQGQVTQVFDPSGVTYNLAFSSSGNLLAETDFANSSSPSVTNYVYTTSQSSPYGSDLTQIYDPDSGVSTPASVSPGAAHSTYVAYNTSGAGVGMASSVQDGTGAVTNYSYADACATGQCLGGTSLQQTTITYPAEVPCPNCTAQSPVEVDTYGAGVETSTSLGSTTSPYLDETWTYGWSMGYGSSNSVETITYPHSLSGTAPTSSVTFDQAGNIISTTDAAGNVATSAYNDLGPVPNEELMWSYAGSSTNSYNNPPTNSWSYHYDQLGNLEYADDPNGNVSSYAYYPDGLLCASSPPTASLSSYSCTGTPPTALRVGDTYYTYDAQGDLSSKTIDWGDTSQGAGPETTTFSYNSIGDQLWSIPPAGQGGAQNASNPYATVTAYSPANLPATETDPGQGTTTYTYDAALNRTISALPIPNTYTITVYDADNRVCYTVTGNSQSGLTCASPAQAGSNATTYVPGSSDAATTTDANGHTTSYYYGDLAYPNAPTEVVDPLSQAIQFTTYDDYGNVCASGPVSQALGTASQCLPLSGDTWSQFDALGDKTSSTDPNGNTTTYQYGDTYLPHAVTEVSNPLGYMTLYSYDYAGNMFDSRDSSGMEISYRFDADRRVTQQTKYMTHPNGSRYIDSYTTITYNGDFEKTSSVTVDCATSGGCYPALPTATFSYSNGQLTGTTDANGKTVNYLYNYAGQEICVGYPVSSSTSCGTISSPATGTTTNTIVTRAYDSYGRLANVTDWLGNTTTYSYADMWEPYSPTSVAYPSSTGVVDSIGYDNVGNVSSISAGPSATDTWSYDANERVAQTTINGATSNSTGYNSNSQVTAAANLSQSTNNDTYLIAPNGAITSDAAPSGSTTSFAYNSQSELCWKSSSASPSICPSPPVNSSMTSYSYAPMGERTSATATTLTPTGTITPVGNLMSSSGTPAASLTDSPVNIGDAIVLSVELSSASATVLNVTGGGATWQELTHVGTNPTVEMWLGTVTATGSSSIDVLYGGSIANSTSSLMAQEFTSGQGANTDWVLDTSATLNSTSSQTNISLPSLTSAGSSELYVGYARTTKTVSSGSTPGFTYSAYLHDLYTYNPSITGTTAPTASQSPAGTYYAAGVLLRATVMSSPSTTYDSWAPSDELCNVSTGIATPCLLGSGNAQTPWNQALPANGTAYYYDDNGVRIGAEASATVGSTQSTSTTDSSWDVIGGSGIPLNINDAETTSSNPGVTTNTSYIYGSLLFGGTAPIEQITGATASFLVSNPTGVQAVFGSSGSVLEKAVYSTYGVPTIQSGSNVTPFGFQGSYTDATGFIYLINRYYDPTTDQFLSVDPLVDQTGQPYVFTNDNPLNSTDPLGLVWWQEGIGNVAGGIPRCFGVDGVGRSPEGDSAGGGFADTGGDAVDFPTDENRLGHIFSDRTGHFAEDTPESRTLIRDAIKPKNLWRVKNGIATYRETLPSGEQVWVEVRDGTITNAGVNIVPRTGPRG